MNNNNTYIFVRHAETIKNASKPAIEWDLTPDALDHIHAYIKDGLFDGITNIYTSLEPKAISTGRPIAIKAKLKITPLGEFNEVKRSDKFLSDEEFQTEKEKQLADWDYKIEGSESANEAFKRFEKGLIKIDNEVKNSTIVVVTHGTVLSIYFSSLLGTQTETYQRWKKLPFCALGIVKDNKVVKDIL